MPHMLPLSMLVLLLLPAGHARQLWQEPEFTIIPPTAPFTTQHTEPDTAGISSTAPAQAPPPALYQQILDLHNTYRADHGALPLAWDTALAQSAARVAATCNFTHSGLPVGENLAAMWGGGSQPARALMVAIDGWYDEVNIYNFNTPGFYQNPGAGHFTQVVWVETARLGCATVYCNGNFWIDPRLVGGTPPRAADMTVCHYAPAGNMVDFGPEDFFRQNVLPKGSKPPGTAAPPSPSPGPPSGGGLNLIGSVLRVGEPLSTGTCLFSDNQLYRLCLTNLGEITVMLGASSNKLRWRNFTPLATRATNRLPYNLMLNQDYTLTVTNGRGKTLLMLALPVPPAGAVSLKLRDDGKAAVLDSAGRCVAAWGHVPGKPIGC
ncbi:CAP domain-containing protein [Scenedesmus sp. NREL 46B-D3]|nr:CAP domain-containing protein [Scenedesmus sp. NREL 46B-D3]